MHSDRDGLQLTKLLTIIDDFVGLLPIASARYML